MQPNNDNRNKNNSSDTDYPSPVDGGSVEMKEYSGFPALVASNNNNNNNNNNNGNVSNNNNPDLNYPTPIDGATIEMKEFTVFPAPIAVNEFNPNLEKQSEKQEEEEPDKKNYAKRTKKSRKKDKRDKEEAKKKKEQGEPGVDEAKAEKKKQKVLKVLDVLGKLFMLIWWLAMTGVFIWYLVIVIGQFVDAQSHYGSSINYINQDVLEMPAVTVCNWNQQLPSANCTFCGLTLNSCQRIFDGGDCMNEWVEMNVTVDEKGTFFCYQWNNNPDPHAVVFSSTTDYGGGYAVSFSAPHVPPDIFNREAIQATFHTPGTTPDAFGETNFIPSSFDGFFSITQLSRTYIRRPPENSFDTVSSLTRLVLNDTASLHFGVSFAYKELSIQAVDEVVTYSLQNLFGDLAGMSGTLMGLDSVKMAAGFVATWFAFYLRSIEPLSDVFNG